MADKCYFKESIIACNNTTDDLISVKEKRIRTIISSSKLRGDKLHTELEKYLDTNENLSISCHKPCVSTYTSTTHIKRALSKRGISPHGASARSQSEPPLTRRRLDAAFEFKGNCIICGCACLPLDKKNPSRWRKVVKCRTVDRPGQKTFKSFLLDTCTKSNDPWANAVQIRISGAPADLHAADAEYHRDYYNNFTKCNNVQYGNSTCTSEEQLKDFAIGKVIESMNEDKHKMWTSVDLYSIYCTYDKSGGVTRRTLIEKLQNILGDEILLL